MNIRDKIRDELYGGNEDELKSEAAAAEYSDLLEGDGKPFGGQKTFLYCAAADAVVAALIIFTPSFVRSIIDGPEIIYGALATFAIGFVATFNVYRILKNDVLPQRDVPIDDGIMSGYSGYERRQQQFTIWLVATAGGVANALLLFILTMLR